jgi:hypothetical protein
MFRAVKVRAPLALVVAGAISVAIAGTGGGIAQASAAGGPFWGAPVVPGGTGEAIIDGATCTSGGTCLTVGEAVANSGAAPLVLAEAGGSWGTPSTASVAGVSNPDAGYLTVSCVSASLCTGVGYNQAGSAYDPIAGPILLSGSTPTAVSAGVLTLPGAPAGNSTEKAGLISVSCNSSGCAAVGYYETTADLEEPIEATGNGSGSWTVSTVAPPPAAILGANLTAVSCPPTGACEAVGSYLDASGHAQLWSVALGSGVAQTIALPSGAATVSGSLPEEPSALDFSTSAALNAISCPSAGVCTAGGLYPVSSGGAAPMAVSISNGTPGKAAPVGSPPGLSLTSLTGLWCADAGDCLADGDIITTSSSGEAFTPVTAYEAAGAWSTLTDLPGGSSASAEVLALGLGCTAMDTCVAAGLEANTSASSIAPFAAFSAPPLSITTTSLPAAVAGVPYSATLQSAGGTGTPTWTVSGSLPLGLSLNASTGVISGTPTVPGTDSLTAQLASAGPPAQTTTVNLSVTVAAVPKLSVGNTKISAAGLQLALGCSGSGTCSGTAIVSAVEHLTGKRATAVTARAKPKKKKLAITLARGSYSLSAGQLGNMKLNLTSRAKALLKRLHKISGKLTLTPTGASAPTVTRTVTFKSAVKKKKKR